MDNNQQLRGDDKELDRRLAAALQRQRRDELLKKRQTLDEALVEGAEETTEQIQKDIENYIKNNAGKKVAEVFENELAAEEEALGEEAPRRSSASPDMPPPPSDEPIEEDEDRESPERKKKKRKEKKPAESGGKPQTTLKNADVGEPEKPEGEEDEESEGEEPEGEENDEGEGEDQAIGEEAPDSAGDRSTPGTAPAETPAETSWPTADSDDQTETEPAKRKDQEEETPETPLAEGGNPPKGDMPPAANDAEQKRKPEEEEGSQPYQPFEEPGEEGGTEPSGGEGQQKKKGKKEKGQDAVAEDQKAQQRQAADLGRQRQEERQRAKGKDIDTAQKKETPKDQRKLHQMDGFTAIIFWAIIRDVLTFVFILIPFVGGLVVSPLMLVTALLLLNFFRKQDAQVKADLTVFITTKVAPAIKVHAIVFAVSNTAELIWLTGLHEAFEAVGGGKKPGAALTQKIAGQLEKRNTTRLQAGAKRAG